ncbi:MAG: Na+/H+ antiporter NhaA [Coriobacteriia bacterium]|nr:Na+/H+ antiporter NhaA [Coriobacteriia bacterium]
MSQGANGQRPYIEQAGKHHERMTRIVHFTHSTTKAAGVMLLAAVAAFFIANSPFYPDFLHFWHADVTFGVGGSVHTMSLAHIVNDVFMAVFFLLVGLEIKYEATAGALTDLRQALLPAAAAVGGVAMPIVVFLAFAGGSPAASGWGVPTATDIAFALGILALLGSRVPVGLKVFLSTLAVVDDIIAILVIAIFYGESPDPVWLLAAAGVLVVLALVNRAHVYSLIPYLFLGVLLWLCVFMSGVHSTIAGVLLAFAIPCRTHVNMADFHDWSLRKLRTAKHAFDPDAPVVAQHEFLETVRELSKVARQVVPPATRLEQRLHPWVYFLILPLFALTNADVCLVDGTLGNPFTNPALYGVFFGLVLGKPAGILLVSAIMVKTGLVDLPAGCTWGHMVGAGVLAGVGFTMAIFVANLAFADAATVTIAKAAILTASLVAGVAGFLILFMQARRA